MKPKAPPPKRLHMFLEGHEIDAENFAIEETPTMQTEDTPPVAEEMPPAGELDPGHPLAGKPAPRPTLECESEVHAHLDPRIEAHLLRVEAWSGVPASFELHTAAEDVRAAWARLGQRLLAMREAGIVVKSTAKTRKLARMKPGTRVQLVDDNMAADYSAMYSPEEIAALEVVRVVGERVFLVTGEREVGLVEVRFLEARK